MENKIIKRKINGLILPKLQQERIKNNQCPMCGLPKDQWERRTDWRCCSMKCTGEFSKIAIYGWPDLRLKAFKRDDHACVKCGEKPLLKTIDGDFISDTSSLVGDHIIPIALGGNEFDLDNVQTLCLNCNKIKTAQDIKKIAMLRRTIKDQKGNMTLTEINQGRKF